MKTKNTLESLKLDGKIVFVRADLNVPIKDGKITDETRIQASMQTIEYLLMKNCTVLLTSHLGRPKGGFEEKYSLKPVATRIQEILHEPVVYVKDCIGDEVKKTLEKFKGKASVLVLENLRFYPQEEKNDPEFAKELAKHADFYINDAFGTAHRAHASTHGIVAHLPSAPGFLLKKEIDYLGSVFQNPKRPLITVLGGSKVSSKLSVLKALLEASDKVLVGGGMAFTFFKAQGLEIGKSLCEDEFLEEARNLMKQYGEKLVLPVDARITDKVSEGQTVEVVNCSNIPADMLGVDIGPATEKLYYSHLKSAQTVLWNGPMGIFEIAEFANGTKSICEYMAELKNCITIVGGGDSVAAVTQMGYESKMSHISTGGGASLEFLEGKTLPGVAALM